jgi:hypothetical protein
VSRLWRTFATNDNSGIPEMPEASSFCCLRTAPTLPRYFAIITYFDLTSRGLDTPPVSFIVLLGQI